MAQEKKRTFTTKPMNSARRANLKAIKAAWGIGNVEQIFDACNTETRNMLRPGKSQSSDDFFEDTTLTLLRQLAEMTRGEMNGVKQRLRVRWRARTKGGENSPQVGALKAGANSVEKNEKLRIDLQDFIGEVSTKESSGKTAGSGAAGPPESARTAASSSHPPLNSGSKRRRDADDNDDEKEDGELPSRKIRSGAAGGTISQHEEQEALLFIRTAWPRNRTQANPFDFSILPEYAYDHVTRDLTRPFQYYRSLLLAIYRLAQATEGRRGEVRIALALAFQDVKEFDEGEAVRTIGMIAKRFEEENSKKDPDPDQGEEGKQAIGTDGAHIATASAGVIEDEAGDDGHAKETSARPEPPAVEPSVTRTPDPELSYRRPSSTDLPTLLAQAATLHTANDSLLASLAQDHAPPPPGTPATLTTLTFDHLLAESQLNEAGLALQSVKLRIARADDKGTEGNEEVDKVMSAEMRMVECELRVEQRRSEVLKALAERMENGKE